MKGKELGLGYLDILKGVGELIVDEGKIVLHALFDSLHREPKASESDHSPQELSEVQKDANEWVEKMGHGCD